MRLLLDAAAPAGPIGGILSSPDATLAVLIAVVIAAAAVVTLLLLRRKKKKNKQNDHTGEDDQ